MFRIPGIERNRLADYKTFPTIAPCKAGISYAVKLRCNSDRSPKFILG
jgi:hypothetical protein